jgi:hypothetical protein
MYFAQLQESLKILLQRDIKLTINNKILREGRLILFNLKDYYIECTMINKNDQQKVYEIPVPFNIDINPNNIVYSYNIDRASKHNLENLVAVKMLASNVGKKSKFYDNTLIIEYR